MNNKVGMLILAAVLGLGALALFGAGLNQFQNQAQPELPQIGGGPGNVGIPDLQQNMESFDVDAKEFEFSVKEMRVDEGDRVRITLTNSGQFPHDLVIDEFNFTTGRVEPGGTVSREFVADKKGTFEYYCSVGNHRAQGMVGRLIVE